LSDGTILVGSRVKVFHAPMLELSLYIQSKSVHNFQPVCRQHTGCVEYESVVPNQRIEAT
jgi:hypothetical protein